MEIILNKVYSFTDMDMSFGTLSEAECIEIFSDGRVCSHFLERQLTKWFPDLYRVDQKGYDHIEVSDLNRFNEDKSVFNGIKYDQKSFTKRGVRFNPSNQIGAGRKFNQEVATEHANSLIYIITDITNLPTVNVVFKQGSDLILNYPKCHIPLKDMSYLF